MMGRTTYNATQQTFVVKTCLFMCFENFYMRDCFKGGVDDSKPVED